MKHLKIFIPWWTRLLAKMVLARLPVTYHVWKKLGLFEHGDMQVTERAWETLMIHTTIAKVLDDSDGKLMFKKTGSPFGVLELGPGDALFTAVMAKQLGAAAVWLSDAAEFADAPLSSYIKLVEQLERQGYPWAAGPLTNSVSELMKVCNAAYLTNGVQGLSAIPDGSIDFCFSNAVLEHIPAKDFNALLAQLKRVLKKDGVCVHRVDLKDHLGGSLNSLRFSDEMWEHRLFRNSGFYTNRIRFEAMASMFAQAGFACEFPRVERWDQLPIERGQLHATFQHLTEDNLRVRDFDVLLRHS